MVQRMDKGTALGHAKLEKLMRSGQTGQAAGCVSSESREEDVKVVHLCPALCDSMDCSQLGSSRVAVSRGYSLVWCADFPLWWLLPFRSSGSRAH